MTTKTSASIYDLLDLAGSLLTDETETRELSCDACDRRIDTYWHAHSAPVQAIQAFLEHCAFDHNGRAGIVVWQPTQRISFSD